MVIEEIKRILKKEKDIELAYLYGSCLKRRDFEDIDIAVLFSNKRGDRYGKMNEIALSLEKKLKKEVDLKDLSELPSFLKYRIISEGILLFSKNKINWIRFEEDVLREFLDFKPVYEWCNKKIIKRKV